AFMFRQEMVEGPPPARARALAGGGASAAVVTCVRAQGAGPVRSASVRPGLAGPGRNACRRDAVGPAVLALGEGHVDARYGRALTRSLVSQPGNDPYCFVEFTDHQSAASALLAMNKRLCYGKVSRPALPLGCTWPLRCEVGWADPGARWSRPRVSPLEWSDSEVCSWSDSCLTRLRGGP
ncbi:hypothetical protein HPB47_020998, partial [Ixodes persulcatus]